MPSTASMKLQRRCFSRENYDTMLHFGWEEENRFAFSLGLASLSSFSLATRTQASLVLARSCVSCTIFSDFVTEIRLHLRTEGRWPKGKANTQINLVFRSICTHFSACFASPADRRHLGKSQKNLTLLNLCLAQQRKCKPFLYFRSLRFAFSLGLHYLCTRFS